MIRRADPSRAPALSRIHAAAFDPGWSAAEFASLMTNGALALEAADQGLILIRNAGDEAEILTLAVSPSARRRGLGRSLVAAGAEAARAAGARTILLEVAADNPGALRLYQGLGFTACGRRPGYYRRGPGGPVDAEILRLDLA